MTYRRFIRTTWRSSASHRPIRRTTWRRAWTQISSLSARSWPIFNRRRLSSASSTPCCARPNNYRWGLRVFFCFIFFPWRRRTSLAINGYVDMRRMIFDFKLKIYHGNKTQVRRRLPIVSTFHLMLTNLLQKSLPNHSPEELRRRFSEEISRWQTELQSNANVDDLMDKLVTDPTGKQRMPRKPSTFPLNPFIVSMFFELYLMQIPFNVTFSWIWIGFPPSFLYKRKEKRKLSGRKTLSIKIIWKLFENFWFQRLALRTNFASHFRVCGVWRDFLFKKEKVFLKIRFWKVFLGKSGCNLEDFVALTIQWIQIWIFLAFRSI